MRDKTWLLNTHHTGEKHTSRNEAISEGTGLCRKGNLGVGVCMSLAGGGGDLGQPKGPEKVWCQGRGQTSFSREGRQAQTGGATSSGALRKGDSLARFPTPRGCPEQTHPHLRRPTSGLTLGIGRDRQTVQRWGVGAG